MQRRRLDRALRRGHGRSAVYGFVNYDPRKSRFAFGIASTASHAQVRIDDIQVFFQNDVRFLRQFP